MKLVRGRICAPALPTCGNNTYDFFVVDSALAASVVAVQRVEGAGLHPHHPSRMLLRTDARSVMVRACTRPVKIGGQLPKGPMQPPPIYSSSVGGIGTASALDAAVADWYTLARSEFSQLQVGCARHFPARLTLRPSVTTPAVPQAGATAASLLLRGLAGDADIAAASIVRNDALGVAAKRAVARFLRCLLYTSPSPRDQRGSRMPSSA